MLLQMQELQMKRSKSGMHFKNILRQWEQINIFSCKCIKTIAFVFLSWSCFKGSSSNTFHWLYTPFTHWHFHFHHYNSTMNWNVTAQKNTEMPLAHHYHCFFCCCSLFFVLCLGVFRIFHENPLKERKKTPNDLMKLSFVTLLKLSFFPLTHSLTHSFTKKTYRLVFSLVIVWPLKSACWEASFR